VFSRILIANRGEIALRIVRACRAMGITSVVAYSEADRESRGVQLADEAICVGPAESRRSYLSAPSILSAAIVAGCEAIHPGYGFLSEDDTFAEMTRAHGLTFIGPPPEVLERFASKAGTRTLLAKHGLPTIPGSGMLRDDAHGMAEADKIGYPVLIKPSAGGGGKGMRMVRSPRELQQAMTICRSEALAAFGDDSLYLEKWLEENRHVEVQVFGDAGGRVVHLHERECSIQRRHQKLVEESPAPNLPAALRARLTEAAVAGARAVGYVNAGTMEFIVHGEQFYFLEMNTRLQVEHPVTEEVTGLDLVQAQLRVASGEPLPWTQEQVPQRGCSIECRVYAEDPARNFMPSPGRISRLVLPAGPGVRVECGVAEGVEVSVHYDPLLAKLIATGATRVDAIERMRGALAAFVVEGVKTVIPFQQRVVDSPAFRAGAVHTQMVEQGAFR